MSGTRWATIAMAALMSVACGGSELADPGPVGQAVNVVVTPPTSTLALNGQLTLQAEVQNADGGIVSNAPIVWTVRDPGIASVSTTGVVTALAIGSTQVAASALGKSGIATITVQKTPVASVVVRPNKVDAVVGSQTALTVTTLDAAQNTLAGRAVIWTSSNQGVATVDANGQVTALAAGTATITATSEGKSDAATFTISPGAVARVDVAPSPVSMVVGQTTQLAATARDAKGTIVTGKSVIWSSSATGVASVSSQGLVTALGAGSATITATIDGVGGTSTVTVDNVPVGSVVVGPQNPSIAVGATTQLTATVRDANGTIVTDRPVSWVSSNTSVATVSGSGVVTGIAPGSATITATSETKSGSSTVTVTLVPVASVTVAPSSLSITAGQTGTLGATVKDASGNVLANRPVIWTSSDVQIATVSQAGVVTGVAAGSVTITASSGGQDGTATVTVGAAPASSIVVTPPASTLTAGQTAMLSATVKDATGSIISNAAVVWTSSDAKVAAVTQSGAVTTAAAGTATITATSGSTSGSCTITVQPGLAAKVTVSPSIVSVKNGKTTVLTAVAVDAKGNVITGRPFTWASSSGRDATVSATGVVTAKRVSVVTITATMDLQSDAAVVTITP